MRIHCEYSWQALDILTAPWYNCAMDNIKSDDHGLPPLPPVDREQLLEGKWKPNWKPETWGGARPGSGRPTLGGDEDPTVKVTVAMPLSLKEAAIEIGGGNMSEGIRRAIAHVAWYGI